MAGKVASTGEVPPRGIVSALALASACAVGIGTFVQFLTVEGQGSVVIIFDWIFAPVWGLAFVMAGRRAARRALKSGGFGPVACAVFGIVLVFTVTLLCFALSIGLPPDPESYEFLSYSAHLGMVYGSLAGFVFWRIMTGRDAGLLPPGRPHYRRRATLVFSGLMCAYTALPALYVALT